MLDFLQAFPLMDEAGDAGGGGGVAVMDSAPDYGDSSGSEPLGDDGQVHDAEVVESAETTSTGTAVVKAGDRMMDRGKLTTSGKAVIEALAPLGPAAQQAVLRALRSMTYFQGEFPGGSKEVTSLRGLVQKYGGEQGIAELGSIKDQMEEIDSLYSRSDPKFLDMITSDDEGKRSLVGLMGPALLKFSQLAPQQFAYQNAMSFAHYLDLERVPVTFGRMADLLNRAAEYSNRGNHELAASLISEIANAHNQLADTLDKVYKASRNAPPMQQANAVSDDRTRQLDEREQGLQKREWERAVVDERKKIYGKTFGELTKGRQITPEQKDTIQGFYDLAMQAKLRAWQNNASRFMSNSDKDGYIKEQFAFFQKAIPESLRQAIQRAMPQKPGPKAEAKSSPNVPRGTTSTNGSAMRIAKKPADSDIDLARTTPSMVWTNQAYLKTGKLVQWA